MNTSNKVSILAARTDGLYSHCDIRLEQHDSGRYYTVWPQFRGVDRPDGSGMSCPSRAVAERLVRAVDDGKAMEVHGIATDTFGETYVRTRWRVLGRILNADLKRLGY